MEDGGLDAARAFASNALLIGLRRRKVPCDQLPEELSISSKSS